MLITLMLLCAFFTAASLAWAATSQKIDLGGRVLKYAATPAVVMETGTSQQKIRLPRKWEIFLGRAGVEWTASQAAFMVLLYMVIGGAAGAAIGLPLLGAIGGAATLYVKLRRDQGKRINKMAEQLPDALMLMATAIRSGLGFQQALQMVADEGAQPLASEFGRFGNDLALGLPIEEALLRLQTRLGTVDGEMLAAALLVQRQTGGNLSEILVNLHDTIRDRQTILGQVRALTAQGRMSGVVLSGIPVFLALVFYVINPDYMRMLLVDPRGQLMAITGTVLMVVGAIIIRKIVSITL